MAKLIITQLVIDESGVPIRSMVVGSKSFRNIWEALSFADKVEDNLEDAGDSVVLIESIRENSKILTYSAPSYTHDGQTHIISYILA